MMEYGIAALAAERYLDEERGYECIDGHGFSCEEGDADFVCVDGGCHHLFKVEARRARGEVKPVQVNLRRLERVAMRYLVGHPEAQALSFEVVDVLIGKGATVQVGASGDAFCWER